MFFVKDQHKNVSSQHPGLKMTEIGSKLGEIWRGMSQEQKQQYQKQAEQAPKTVRKSKQEKEETTQKPKRALNAYMKFSQKQRANIMSENPGLKITEISKKIGQMWGQLSEQEKLQFK
jgi:structure-specific recognition protein 1